MRRVKEKHPFLVYGTLRPGFGNYAGLLEGHTTSEEKVTVDGYEMWGASGCPFVMRSESPEARIVGNLIYVEKHKYRRVQRHLDSLEGFYGENHPDNWYTRRLIDVVSQDGSTVKAWIYVVEGEVAELTRNQYSLIPDGDWQEHKEREALAESWRWRHSR